MSFPLSDILRVRTVGRSLLGHHREELQFYPLIKLFDMSESFIKSSYLIVQMETILNVI